MKTAMQELISEMSHPNWDRLSFDARYEMFDNLLNLEKLQIMKAFQSGWNWNSDSEKYYKETYNQNEI